MSFAETDGIQIQVSPVFLEEHSQTSQNRFVFAYKIEIKNMGDKAAQLKSRHWIIADSCGTVEEVSGPGVVGETPYIGPGQSHSYQSFCVLKTGRGSMHGTYTMVRDDGSSFEAEIAPFVLAAPNSDVILN